MTERIELAAVERCRLCGSTQRTRPLVDDAHAGVDVQRCRDTTADRNADASFRLGVA